MSPLLTDRNTRTACERSNAPTTPALRSAIVIKINADASEVAGPAWLQQGQIPSLNGLRALSIILVVIAHLCHQGHWIPHDGRWIYFGSLGRLGVDMFFVISGFLITLLLLREQERDQRISLKQFYLRRACRILPAYVCYLAAVGVLCTVGSISLRLVDWAGALTYTVNFVSTPNMNIAHIWSLSVEEHFYLLWPLAVRFAPRRAWMGATAVIALMPGMRWLVQKYIPYLDVGHCSLTCMDTIAMGCCLAYLVRSPAFRRTMNMPVRHAYWTSAALVLLVGLSEYLTIKSSSYELVFHRPVVGAAYAVTIWLWTVRAHSLVGCVLNSKPAVILGVLSYSIYLWQQPFVNPHSDQWFVQSPFNLVFMAVLACASYLLVERPVLKLKERLCSPLRPVAGHKSSVSFETVALCRAA